MKLSKLLAASLTLVSAVAVLASAAEARNPAKGGGLIGLGVPTVFAAECGTDPATFASFNGSSSTQNVPLTVSVNESTVLTSGYAGDVVFIPTANLDLTVPSTFTPMTQGTYGQTLSVRPSTYTGDPGYEVAVLFSFVKSGSPNVTRYGASFVPASFINVSTPISNHALKGKSVDSFISVDTVLSDIAAQGGLVNVLPAPNNAVVGPQASNFQLLGLASALVNVGGAGTNVNATFANFTLNGATLQESVDPATNINCIQFIGGNAGQAAQQGAVAGR